MLVKKILPYMFLLILTGYSLTGAEVVTFLNLGSGYSDNIFYDSLQSEDSYTKAGGTIEFYPSSSIQISGYGQYSAYKTNNDLTNIYAGGSINVIPTSELSPVTIVLGGDFSFQQFGEYYRVYNQNSYKVQSQAIYKVGQKFVLNSRVSYSEVKYLNSDYGSRQGITLSGGLNFVPWGQNSLKFGVDSYLGSYKPQIQEANSGTNGRNNRGDDLTDYRLVDLSIRYSRPLNKRTGFSVTYENRKIRHQDNFMANDFELDNLSPFSNLWEGSGVSAYMKHFFPHQFTLVLSGGYLDKSFIDVVSYTDTTLTTIQTSSRDDQNIYIYTSLSKPIAIGDANILTPSVIVRYSSNSSSDPLYDYSGLSGMVSMNLKF